MPEAKGYSAKVALTLVVGDKKLSLSHVSPGRIVVKDPCDPISPRQAILRIRVDDSRKARRIYLPDGVPGPRRWVRIAKTPF